MPGAALLCYLGKSGPWNELLRKPPGSNIGLRCRSLRGNPLICDCQLKWLVQQSFAFPGNCRFPSKLKNKNLRGVPEKDLVCSEYSSSPSYLIGAKHREWTSFNLRKGWALPRCIFYVAMWSHRRCSLHGGLHCHVPVLLVPSKSSRAKRS